MTGTVIVPGAKWSGKGERPVVRYAEGTQGLAHQCAPSLQMAEGTEYDGGAIIGSLKKGYAVAVTDSGLHQQRGPYIRAGKAEGQAVLDIVRAGRQLPGSGITERDSGDRVGLLTGWPGGQLGRGAAVELRAERGNDRPGGGRRTVEPAGDRRIRQRVGRHGFGIDGLIGLRAAYPEEFDLAAL